MNKAGYTDRRMDGQTDGWTDGCLEIPPCVLQDIRPLGPLPMNGFYIKKS